MKRLFPVIHAENIESMLKDYATCVYADINQIFLIDHNNAGPQLLIDSIHEIRDDESNCNAYPMFVGVNFLCYPTWQALVEYFKYNHMFNALWVDNTHPDDVSVLRSLEIIKKYLCPTTSKLFGGVGFKYQKHKSEITLQCDNVMHYVDVLTTSGNATGKAPAIEKLKLIQPYRTTHRVAIASGVSLENIEAFLPYADDFLVYSSVANADGRLNGKKLKELNKIINDYEA